MTDSLFSGPLMRDFKCLKSIPEMRFYFYSQ